MSTGIFAVAFAAILANQAFCAVSKPLSFNPEKLSVIQARGFGQIRMEGCFSFGKPGDPALLAKPIFISLPQGEEAVSIVATVTESVIVATSIVPQPLQPPAILPMPGKYVPKPAFVEPNPAVYHGSAAYPPSLVQGLRSGYIGGSPVAAAAVVPMRWRPGNKTLVFYTRIELHVATRASGKQAERPSIISPVGLAYRDSLRSWLGLPAPIWLPELSRDALDYLIVCARDCSTAYAELAEWKTRKGLKTQIITMEKVESTYPGPDEQAKIRACILDHYENQGVWCVLLGNDSEHMLTRKVWAMDCEAGFYPDENEIRADLYFSDLDGSRDADSDGTYGEISDLVDMFPDVLVGRLPADNPIQAQGMVEKSLVYERTAPADYHDKTLFFAEVLWSDPYTDGGIAKDMIDSLCFPSSLDPIEKQYQSLGNESPASVLAALNEGRNLANHAGHANSYMMGCGTGYISDSDMDDLSNTSRYTVMYSIGCWPAALELDCIAEHFLQNGSGGGVAFVGNCRYGWGSPGNPGFGYSDLYDTEFWRNALTFDGCTTGRALAQTKITFIPFSQEENVYRWDQYQVNLLGEPDLPIWSDQPIVPVVAYPEELFMGEQVCRISVEAETGPIKDALVCLCQTGGIYTRAFSDESGTASFSLALESASPVDLTVSGHNLRPYLTTLPVVSTGAYVDVSSFGFLEVQAPANGVPNPGEELFVDVALRNTGNSASGPITMTLRSVSPLVTISDSMESCGSLLPGDSEEITQAFCLTLSSSCGPGDGFPLELEIHYPPEPRTTILPLVVGMPHPISTRLTVEDEARDGYPDPGEQAELGTRLFNAGNDTTYSLQGSIYSLDGWLSVLQGSTTFGTLAPNEEIEGAPPFTIQLAAGSPSPRTALVVLDLQDSRWVWQDTLCVPIGAIGFQDEMEFGQGGWSFPGVPNHWHISSFCSHSGGSSWYCGNESSHHYVNSSSDTLLSPDFVLDAESGLSFWLWFDVTIYGTDGLYVEIQDGENWITLGYIGSGGALEEQLMGHDWVRYTYDLDWLAASAQSRVRFIFKSDGSEVAEGFYLDDVEVSATSRVASLPDDVTARQAGENLELHWSVVRRDNLGRSLPRPVQFYNVYRDMETWFVPGASNLLASSVEDEEPGRPGVQWTDFSSSVGDPLLWQFYLIRPVWGGVEGERSAPMGHVDYLVEDGE